MTLRKLILGTAIAFAMISPVIAAEDRKGFCAGEANFKACVNADQGKKEHYYPPEAHKACSELEEYVSRKERQEWERCLAKETSKLQAKTEKVTCLGNIEDDADTPVGGLHHLHWIRADDDQDRKLRLDRHPQWSATCWAKIPEQLWKKVKPICDTGDVCLITGTVVIPEDDSNKYWKSTKSGSNDDIPKKATKET